jgi:hypothetical protein
MQNKLKTYQIILTILILPICLFLFVSFGWSSYATITERPGLNGNMYMYYDLTKLQFAIYTGLVSIAGLFFGLTVLIKTFRIDKSKLTRTFKFFLFFFIVFILCEIYLQARFVGKG